MNEVKLIKYYKKITELEKRKTDEFLKGEISTDEFLDFRGRIDRNSEIICRVFPDYDRFASHMRTNHPLAAEDDIEHEKEHWEIAKRHGLDKTRFAVLEGGELHAPMLIDYMGENCRGWTKERIIDYMKETYGGVRVASYADDEISSILG